MLKYLNPNTNPIDSKLDNHDVDIKNLICLEDLLDEIKYCFASLCATYLHFQENKITVIPQNWHLQIFFCEND